jgi:protein gp37
MNKKYSYTSQSKIEWTTKTWNPTTGCNKVSAGCKNCYAEKMAKRLMAMGQKKYKNNFELTLHPDTLDTPLSWKKSQVVFVNSMSDLLHKDVPNSFILQSTQVMNDTLEHTYQILTKRADRLPIIDPFINWTENIWMGTSIENSKVLHRLDDLKKSSAKYKFLSLEPLLGPLENLDLNGIDWVIVGGESGPKARPMEEKWVLDIRDQCQQQGVKFFFKQWGGTNKKKAGRLLQGQVYNEMPTAIAQTLINQKLNIKN